MNLINIDYLATLKDLNASLERAIDDDTVTVEEAESLLGACHSKLLTYYNELGNVTPLF